MLSAGRDPLEEYRFEKLPIYEPIPASNSRIGLLLTQWIDACTRFDANHAEDILNQAFAMYPVEQVCVEVIQNGLNTIGTHWQFGKASVQQEHFMSALAVRRLQTLIMAAPRATRKQTVVVGCPPGEQHDFPILLLSLFLRRRGIKVIDLGKDIPVEDLRKTILTINPHLVVFAAQYLTSASALQTAARSLPGVSLAYGGLIFNRIPRLRERIQGHFLGETVTEAVRTIEQLLSGPISAVKDVHAELSLREGARVFRENRSLIESMVYEKLKSRNLPTISALEANRFLGDGLAAALDLGDVEFIEPDLEWVKHLLSGREIPEDQLHPYLMIYVRTIGEVLGVLGDPISTWLDVYIKKENYKLGK
jgi:methanogenic corrinoid protein MtbC1